ncbi:MAG: ABC transporter permease, partial [Bacteroidota bacterium]
MFQNQIKYAVRILMKDGIYSLLNVLGLTLGISVGVILFLYLQSEFSYDAHHEKANQIYRLSVHLQANGADFNTARTARELAPVLKSELPEVINYVRFNDFGRTLVSTQEDNGNPVQFYEENIMQVDSSFLSVFTHEVLEGNREDCLNGPGKVVITQSTAKKYYGSESPIGKTIRIGGNDSRQIA